MCSQSLLLARVHAHGSGCRTKEVANQDHMEDVKRTILGMSEFMTVIQGSQKYLARKLERHQKTMVGAVLYQRIYLWPRVGLVGGRVRADSDVWELDQELPVGLVDL